jgi:phosphoadenosine phosphosulfate reductase
VVEGAVLRYTMAPMRVTTRDLDALNRRFEAASATDILRFVHDTFGPRAAILSSMQRAGTALCHMADRAGLAFDVLFVDTGVLHAQTLATRDELARTHTRLRVLTLSPARTFEEQTADDGLLYLTKEGQERCCDLRKSLPLLERKGSYDALVSALRQGEGGARSAVLPFAIDPAMNALRVHPLWASDDADLARYLGAHPDAVTNPLHAMGFPTIGCFPCTTPVRPDEPERAGRWRHLAGVEYCGINPGDRGQTTGFVDLDARYAALFTDEGQ